MKAWASECVAPPTSLHVRISCSKEIDVNACEPPHCLRLLCSKALTRPLHVKWFYVFLCFFLRIFCLCVCVTLLSCYNFPSISNHMTGCEQASRSMPLSKCWIDRTKKMNKAHCFRWAREIIDSQRMSTYKCVPFLKCDSQSCVRHYCVRFMWFTLRPRSNFFRFSFWFFSTKKLEFEDRLQEEL